MGMLLCSALVLLLLVPTQKLERQREPGGVGALRTRSMPWPPSHSESLQGRGLPPGLPPAGPHFLRLCPGGSAPATLGSWLLPTPQAASSSGTCGSVHPPRLLMTLPFTSFGFLRSITCRHNLPCSCSLKTANPSASRKNPLAFSALFSRRHLTITRGTLRFTYLFCSRSVSLHQRGSSMRPRFTACFVHRYVSRI